MLFPSFFSLPHLLLNMNGPKKSRAVTSHAGAGFNLSVGSLPIICMFTQFFFLHFSSDNAVVLDAFDQFK